jgi:S1-C subfamily serine protease
VRVFPVSPALKAQFPQLSEGALEVHGVVAGSPAQKGGLQKWDIVVAFNGVKPKNFEHFRQLVEQSSGAIAISIIRGAQEMEIKVEIEEKK